MKTSAFSVSTTAVLLIPADNIHRECYLHTLGAGTVYIGGPDVTAANGMLTEKNAIPFTFQLPAGEALYGITASGTESVRIMTPSVD